MPTENWFQAWNCQTNALQWLSQVYFVGKREDVGYAEQTVALTTTDLYVR